MLKKSLLERATTPSVVKQPVLPNPEMRDRPNRHAYKQDERGMANNLEINIRKKNAGMEKREARKMARALAKDLIRGAKAEDRRARENAQQLEDMRMVDYKEAGPPIQDQIASFLQSSRLVLNANGAVLTDMMMRRLALLCRQKHGDQPGWYWQTSARVFEPWEHWQRSKGTLQYLPADGRIMMGDFPMGELHQDFTNNLCLMDKGRIIGTIFNLGFPAGSQCP